jgi:hypothetical protein
MKIRCTTSFDITATGVTGHCKPSRIPFTDDSGTSINNEQDWNLARNKQRNWETITQLISLRTQVDNITQPVQDNDHWTFEFEVEAAGIFAADGDPLGVLKQDCAGVPMLLGTTDTVLTMTNIRFDIINISVE